MKNYYLFALLIIFIGCSNKEVEQAIQNKNDSILNLKLKYTESQTEVADLKKLNIQLNEENQNLKNDIAQIKKSIAIENEGPAKENILKDLDKYFDNHGAWFIGAKREKYTANVIGKSESKSSDFYIAQCNGKISFTGNDLSGGGLYDAFEFQAEVRYKKFGGKWQFDDVNLKIFNRKRSR